MVMYVYECGRECIDTVKKVLESTLSWFHSYYATSCIDVGICRSVVVHNGEDIAVGVFYSVDPISAGVIYYVGVLPRYRGRGVGKIVVASIEEILSLRRASVFLATTRSNNIASRKMLKDLGYLEIDLDVIDEGAREAVVMLSCGYEDDLLYVKVSEVTVEEFFSKLTEEQNLGTIETIWRNVCYTPWRRIRERD